MRRELYDALVAVSQSIGSVLGPPVEYLISNFGSLLGSVLELAGALYTALEPVLTGHKPTILGDSCDSGRTTGGTPDIPD